MKKTLISIILSFVMAQAWAVDTYNPANGQLTIPTVVVGDKLYTNVVVAISGVVAVNGGAVNSYWDTYNTSNGQLTIPAVTVGSITYNNVVASVSSVVSIGGILNANPNITNAGNWIPVTDPQFISSIYNGQLANTFHSLISIGNTNQYGLVSTGWAYSGSPASLTKTAPVNIAILEPQTDGNLLLATSNFVTDPRTNGSGSVIVADFNKDGKDDIFLAAHNESPFIAMPSTAYLSNNSSKYSKIILKDSVMAHDAQLAFVNDDPIVITGTFTPGDINPIYTFNNGQFVGTIHPELDYLGMDVALVKGEKENYYYVRGDVCQYFNIITKKCGAQNIQVFSFNSYTLSVPKIIPIQDIIPYLSTLKQYQNFPSLIGGPGLTHTYRLWSEDANHDGIGDILVGQSMWSSASFPSALQILIGNGDGTFTDATNKLNSEMNLDSLEHDYTPSFIDLDKSGIKSYLFSGSTCWIDPSRQNNYLLLNDGTGKIHIALHDQFNYYLSIIYKVNNLSFSKKNICSKFIAIPQTDGSLNFVSELQISGPTINNINVVAYQYLNFPLRYNPKTDFTQNITVSDRNNSMLMRTWAGNDIFYDTNANAKPTKIDGGLGANKVIYSGSSAQYSVSRNTNGTATVISLSSAPIQVNDTLTNIQQIQFSDKTLSLN